MEKLRESSNALIKNIQNSVAELVQASELLDEQAKGLAEAEARIKEREAACSAVESITEAQAQQEARKQELLKLQKEIADDKESLVRDKKAFVEEKEKWEKQKEADQRGIDNERQDIRNQNAALAKEKAEYKDKIMKQLKAGV